MRLCYHRLSFPPKIGCSPVFRFLPELSVYSLDKHQIQLFLEQGVIQFSYPPYPSVILSLHRLHSLAFSPCPGDLDLLHAECSRLLKDMKEHSHTIHSLPLQNIE